MAESTNENAPRIGHNPRAKVRQEADLVCEALVREIARGNRWTAVIEAWHALITVRRIERDLISEQKHLQESDSAGAHQ